MEHVFEPSIKLQNETAQDVLKPKAIGDEIALLYDRKEVERFDKLSPRRIDALLQIV